MLYYVHSKDFLHSSNENGFFVVVRTVQDTIFILSENGKYSKQEAGMSDDFNLPRRKSDIKPYRRVMASEGDSVSEMTQHCIFLVSAIVISRAFAGGVINPFDGLPHQYPFDECTPNIPIREGS